MNDGINIINEYKSGSFQGDYQSHFNKIQIDTGDMSKQELLDLSLQIYNTLNLNDTEVHISDKPLNIQDIYIEPQADRLSMQIIEELSNYINTKLINAKQIKFYTIISYLKFDERSKRFKIGLDFQTVDFDFENDDKFDVQIQTVKDYIKIKDSYGLTSIEMDKLSKKQKRFLLYNLEKNDLKNK